MSGSIEHQFFLLVVSRSLGGKMPYQSPNQGIVMEQLLSQNEFLTIEGLEDVNPFVSYREDKLEPFQLVVVQVLLPSEAHGDIFTADEPESIFIFGNLLRFEQLQFSRVYERNLSVFSIKFLKSMHFHSVFVLIEFQIWLISAVFSILLSQLFDGLHELKSHFHTDLILLIPIFASFGLEILIAYPTLVSLFFLATVTIVILFPPVWPLLASPLLAEFHSIDPSLDLVVVQVILWFEIATIDIVRSVLVILCSNFIIDVFNFVMLQLIFELDVDFGSMKLILGVPFAVRKWIFIIQLYYMSRVLILKVL